MHDLFVLNFAIDAALKVSLGFLVLFESHQSFATPMVGFHIVCIDLECFCCVFDNCVVLFKFEVDHCPIGVTCRVHWINLDCQSVAPNRLVILPLGIKLISSDSLYFASALLVLLRG